MKDSYYGREYNVYSIPTHKAMVESWVITSTESSDVDTLSRNVDFHMAHNQVNRVQQADSPHNWVFGGMYGFRKGDKRR